MRQPAKLYLYPGLLPLQAVGRHEAAFLSRKLKILLQVHTRAAHFIFGIGKFYVDDRAVGFQILFVDAVVADAATLAHGGAAKVVIGHHAVTQIVRKILPVHHQLYVVRLLPLVRPQRIYQPKIHPQRHPLKHALLMAHPEKLLLIRSRHIAHFAVWLRVQVIFHLRLIHQIRIKRMDAVVETRLLPRRKVQQPISHPHVALCSKKIVSLLQWVVRFKVDQRSIVILCQQRTVHIQAVVEIQHRQRISGIKHRIVNLSLRRSTAQHPAQQQPGISQLFLQYLVSFRPPKVRKIIFALRRAATITAAATLILRVTHQKFFDDDDFDDVVMC